MRYDSTISKSEVFFVTGAIAAHASAQGEPVRQRDVKFMIELFSNWVVSTSRETALPLQNTQVSRFIDFLLSEGLARRVAKRGRPTYRLTRVGLIELLSRVVHRDYFDNRPHFFFLYYFVKNYRPRLEQLVESEGKLFPLALKVELEELLDTNALLLRELQSARAELERQKGRIKESILSANFLQAELNNGKPFKKIVKEIEKQYPYELNSQKPLSELIAGIPDDQQCWELGEGSLMRIKEIWEPMEFLLKAYVAQLEKLYQEES